MTSVLPTLAPSLERAKGLARDGRESARRGSALSTRTPAKIGGKIAPKLADDFSRECTDGLVAAWRRRYGRNAVANVAARLGAPVDTVDKWFRRGGVSPSGEWWPRILAAYSPDFLDDALGGSIPWVRRAARREALERELAVEAEVRP